MTGWRGSQRQTCGSTQGWSETGTTATATYVIIDAAVSPPVEHQLEHQWSGRESRQDGALQSSGEHD